MIGKDLGMIGLPIFALAYLDLGEVSEVLDSLADSE